MKKGYDVFGPAYGVMLRNDLHAPGSIDHELMQEMILLEEGSYDLLYRAAPVQADMRGHALQPSAMQFKGDSERQTIDNILRHTAQIAGAFQAPFKEMKFGGTEQEILERGTDWCADMARVGAVLLQCCGIPARIVHLADLDRAYYGHVVTEAFYEGKYGVCDFLHGYRFYDGHPLDAWELMRCPAHLAGYPEDYASMFRAAAIVEYDPMGNHDYTVSGPNQYTINVIERDHGGRWIMGEDGSAQEVLYLETERLILRPHVHTDFEDYFSYIMDPELRDMLGLRGVDDRASAQETFQWLLENGEFIALIGRDSGRVIGHICVQSPNDKVVAAPEFRDKKGASLSFAIAKWERRKGLMLEALRCLTAQKFREGTVDYFDCEYQLRNAASRGIQEKLGFQYWGKERFGDEELIINILWDPTCPLDCEK